eukprot:4992275-Pleurochrysis_carterae.AAC.1
MSPTKAKAIGKAITLEMTLERMTPAQRTTLVDTLISETQKDLQGPQSSTADNAYLEAKLKVLEDMKM